VRRVLLIAFFFPPINVVGSVRPAKFAKFLPEFGWEPTVLTVDNFATRPTTMPVEISTDRIVRAEYPDPIGYWIKRLRGSPSSSARATESKPRKTMLYSLARRMLDINVVRMPDRALTWYRPAVRHGLQLLSEQRFDAILSTSPPPTANLVASTLARRTGLPWLADFRDLWTMNHSFHRSQPWQALEETFERRVLRTATSLLTVSPALVSKLQSFTGKQADVLTNGFDPDMALQDAPPLSSKLTISYTGSLYAGKQDPSPLFEALCRLRDERRLSSSELAVRFYGSDLGDLEDLIARYQIGDLVSHHDTVPYLESLRRQRESAALLFLDWNDPLEPGVYSLKVLEYLGAGRPILAIGHRHDSLVNQLLVSCKVGQVLSSTAQVQAQLLVWLNEFRQNGRLTFQGDLAEIQKYSYRNLACQLAEKLDRVVDKNS
jgi:glycosyltransferase involved in cell wall biosynthesis